MYISDLTPHPVSSSAIPRWLVAAAAVALASLVTAAALLAGSSPMPGPRQSDARQESAHSGQFRAPVTYLSHPRP
jgi:hypothetical protein